MQNHPLQGKSEQHTFRAFWSPLILSQKPLVQEFNLSDNIKTEFLKCMPD